MGLADRVLANEYRDFTMRSTVGIVFGGLGGAPAANGTGALLRVGGRHVVLTAAHVTRADTAQRATAATPGLIRRGLQQPLVDFVERGYPHPKSVHMSGGASTDVTVLLLKSQFDQMLVLRPAPFASVVAKASAPVPDHQFLSVTGYSASLVDVDEERESAKFKTYTAIPTLRSQCRGPGHP